MAKIDFPDFLPRRNGYNFKNICQNILKRNLIMYPFIKLKLPISEQCEVIFFVWVFDFFYEDHLGKEFKIYNCID